MNLKIEGLLLHKTIREEEFKEKDTDKVIKYHQFYLYDAESGKVTKCTTGNADLIKELASLVEEQRDANVSLPASKYSSSTEYLPKASVSA